MQEEEAAILVDSMIEHNGIELLVHRLTQLVEANSDEEGKAVFNILAIFENMVEVKPEVPFGFKILYICIFFWQILALFA